MSIYHGLQLQLVVYMDAAVQAEQRKYPDCEVEVNYGGQPIYYYIISVE